MTCFFQSVHRLFCIGVRFYYFVERGSRKMPLPKPKKLDLVSVPDHVVDRWMEKMDHLDPDETMREFLVMVKKDPCLLASWESDMTFDEACKKYGVK